MRSLFCASSIMLMVYSYIEISSGMDPGGSDGESVSLNTEPRQVMRKDKNKYRLYDTHTQQFVGTGERPSLRVKDPGRYSYQLDWNKKEKRFDHHYMRFVGDKSYKEGTPEYKFAMDIQIAHALKQQQQAIPVDPRTGLPMMQSYESFAELHGLKPVNTIPGSHGADFQNQLVHSAYVSTPSVRVASKHMKQRGIQQQGSSHYPQQSFLAGFQPSKFYQQPENLMSQADHTHLGNTHLLGHGSAGGNHQGAFNLESLESHNFDWNKQANTQHVDTMHSHATSAPGFEPQFDPNFNSQFLNWGQQQLSTQPEYPLVGSHHLGQEFVAGNYPNQFIAGEHDYSNQQGYSHAHTQDQQHASAAGNYLKSFIGGHDMVFDPPDAGMLKNSLSFESSSSHHSNPSSRRHSRSRHQQ